MKVDFTDIVMLLFIKLTFFIAKLCLTHGKLIILISDFKYKYVLHDKLKFFIIKYDFCLNIFFSLSFVLVHFGHRILQGTDAIPSKILDK